MFEKSIIFANEFMKGIYEMDGKILSRITRAPKVMAGKPVIRGTRVPVDRILKMLSQNISVDKILSEYPRLCKDDIQAALLYGSVVINEGNGSKTSGGG